jgi:putative redox protein
VRENNTNKEQKGRLNPMSEKTVSIKNKEEVKESEKLRITSTQSLEDDRVMVKVRQHKFSVGWPGSESGPCPGEYMLGALAGCSSGVASLIAKQMNFDMKGMTFEMSQSSTAVAATARITTTESDERIQELKKATEHACPVHKFFKSTGIKMEIDWQRA